MNYKLKNGGLYGKQEISVNVLDGGLKVVRTINLAPYGSELISESEAESHEIAKLVRAGRLQLKKDVPVKGLSGSIGKFKASKKKAAPKESAAVKAPKKTVTKKIVKPAKEAKQGETKQPDSPKDKE